MDLLHLLSRTGVEGASAGFLIRRLKVPRASFYRLTKELLDRGLVAQDHFSGNYRLGHATMLLGSQARKVSPLAQYVKPLLSEITRTTRQMSELAISVGGQQLMMLDVWLAENTSTSIISRSGFHFALDHLSAHGLCYLTFDGNHRLQSYLKECDSSPRLKRKSPDVLKDECRRWKRLGFTRCRNSDARKWILRMAVPVFDPHANSARLAGSLGIVCKSDDLGSQRAAEWIKILKTQARALEKHL